MIARNVFYPQAIGHGNGLIALDTVVKAIFNRHPTQLF
jgi:hypothetical protein